MNITEKISRLVPGITVAETGDQVVTVPVESFRQVAEALRNDKDEPMDFLRDIVSRLLRLTVRTRFSPQYVISGKLQKSKNAKCSTSLVSVF